MPPWNAPVRLWAATWPLRWMWQRRPEAAQARTASSARNLDRSYGVRKCWPMCRSASLNRRLGAAGSIPAYHGEGRDVVEPDPAHGFGVDPGQQLPHPVVVGALQFLGRSDQADVGGGVDHDLGVPGEGPPGLGEAQPLATDVPGHHTQTGRDAAQPAAASWSRSPRTRQVTCAPRSSRASRRCPPT